MDNSTTNKAVIGNGSLVHSPERLERSTALSEQSPIVLSPSLEQPTDDWSETTQDWINTLPKLWTRGLFYLILGFTAIALPWAALTRIDEVGLAKGRLEPKGKPLQLDAPVGGTITAIHVAEGQHVHAKQKLLELSFDRVKADLQQAKDKLEGQKNRLAQFAVIKRTLENSAQTQQQQLQAKSAEQVAEISKIQSQIPTQQKSLKLAEDLLAMDQRQIENFRRLQRQGAISKSQVEEVERNSISNHQQLQRIQAELHEAEGEKQKQKRSYETVLRDGELAMIESEKQLEEIQVQITELQSDMVQTQNQIKSLRFQEQQRVMYSPINGTLFQMPIKHPGAVIQPGQTIAQIAPVGAELVLKAQMANKDTGFLRVGLPVKIKFDAYPFQDYGIVTGKISWVSPDSKIVQSDSDQNNQSFDLQHAQNVFELEVELDQPYIGAKNAPVLLKPGQTATADVIIRKRRVLDLFLDPFRKLQAGGL